MEKKILNFILSILVEKYRIDYTNKDTAKSTQANSAFKAMRRI